MRAVRLVGPGQPVEEQEVARLEPGAGEVRVRVEAAGICHSDVHYRSGFPVAGPLPLTLGHEVAGSIDAIGPAVAGPVVGDRVCLHYQVSCGDCAYCVRGTEQFCTTGEMIGMRRDGGYAEYITLPARNVFAIPEEVATSHAAIMMCSSATSFHALRKGRLAPGERVAVFGIGGLGASAVQLAVAMAAAEVFAVDLDDERLELARRFGAHPIDAKAGDAGARLAAEGGVDLALELIGLPDTIEQAVAALRPMGRAVVVGLSERPFSVYPYQHLITREAEIIGSADHLAQELPTLLDFAGRGALDLGDVVTAEVPLDAAEINATMDNLERFGAGVRTVITPDRVPRSP
jgi:propanol-preferring alcohol dehydrogenase